MLDNRIRDAHADMVAVLVAIPRQPCARGLTAAPPEPRDRAGTLGDASSALVDAVNDLMRLLDNISHFLSHKMNNHNQHHIIVGTVKQHGCDPVHGGIHNHIGNWTSCGVHDDFEQPEVKPFHPDLLGKHLDHDGIVRANLEITACPHVHRVSDYPTLLPPTGLQHRTGRLSCMTTKGETGDPSAYTLSIPNLIYNYDEYPFALTVLCISVLLLVCGQLTEVGAGTIFEDLSLKNSPSRHTFLTSMTACLTIKEV